MLFERRQAGQSGVGLVFDFGDGGEEGGEKFFHVFWFCFS